MKTRIAVASLFAALSLSAAAAKVADVSAESQKWVAAQADSQKRVDGLAQERTDLSDKYRSTLRESEGLKLYIQQLGMQLKSQDEEVATIQTEMRDIERTSVEILPLMQNMLASLNRFVDLDLPFLAEERHARLRKLQEMMPRADVTVSEKYRRIVEAYQIEMEYGRTIEAYTGEIKGRSVDFLRVGRVALLYQAPDGTETGYWDASKNSWVADADYADSVREGLKVAKKQTSPDLLQVPVPAAKKGA